jgi:hypothetical protein
MTILDIHKTVDWLIEQGYSKENALYTTAELLCTETIIQWTVSRYIESGEIPDKTIAIAGYSVTNIMSRCSTNYIGALLTINWIITNPEAAMRYLKTGEGPPQSKFGFTALDVTEHLEAVDDPDLQGKIAKAVVAKVATKAGIADWFDRMSGSAQEQFESGQIGPELIVRYFRLARAATALELYLSQASWEAILYEACQAIDAETYLEGLVVSILATDTVKKELAS